MEVKCTDCEKRIKTPSTIFTVGVKGFGGTAYLAHCSQFCAKRTKAGVKTHNGQVAVFGKLGVWLVIQDNAVRWTARCGDRLCDSDGIQMTVVDPRPATFAAIA
jgi:hypothetical protein